ncbi:hypothetical protein scyTo_0013548 [Scyliorhinus torazame]|uniref:Uncharacterized protein n=1 Tax=Scyliorhinus torazame TaxID=75743 RepID=A0A401NZ91_SCYTO|nr:hypothetical protein [Scyliorhinus torazame]
MTDSRFAQWGKWGWCPGGWRRAGLTCLILTDFFFLSASPFGSGFSLPSSDASAARYYPPCTKYGAQTV